jgi:transcriptional regulator with XRE-family HTH domain
MATAAEVGPAGRVVGENIRRFRQASGLSLRDLEALLRELGRPIFASGLHRLEQGKRRIDADELTTLATVLSVNPARLLTASADEDRLSAGDIERHRELLDAAAVAVRTVVDEGLSLRGVLDHIELVLTLAALKNRPDLQDVYLRAYEAGNPPQPLPLALQSAEKQAERREQRLRQLSELDALVKASDPRVEYHPGTGPGTDSYTLTRYPPSRTREEVSNGGPTRADQEGDAG